MLIDNFFLRAERQFGCYLSPARRRVFCNQRIYEFATNTMNMKMKTLAIIFSLSLLITLASGMAIFLAKEKNQPVISQQIGTVEKQAEPVKATSAASEKNATPSTPLVRGEKKIEQPQAISALAEEKIKAVMLINGVKYEAEVKAGASAYDLMNELKQNGKISFSGKNYSGLGFFVEEINGLKNNPLAENWIYYVNGNPAPVGISNYLIKNDDVLEWRYEKKSF